MSDRLAAARAAMSEHLAPFLDQQALADARLSNDGLTNRATAAVVSALSRDFVLTPRRPLLAVIKQRDQDGDADALAKRVVLLEIALAAARIR